MKFEMTPEQMVEYILSDEQAVVKLCGAICGVLSQSFRRKPSPEIFNSLTSNDYKETKDV